MLQIGRKQGESIIIGNRVTVTVLEVKGRQVRLGFDFPEDLPVHREEVYRRILDENIKAANSSHLLNLLKKGSDSHANK